MNISFAALKAKSSVLHAVWSGLLLCFLAHINWLCLVFNDHLNHGLMYDSCKASTTNGQYGELWVEGGL